MNRQQRISMVDRIRSTPASAAFLLIMVVVALSSYPATASGDAPFLFPQDASNGCKLFLNKN